MCKVRPAKVRLNRVALKEDDSFHRINGGNRRIPRRWLCGVATRFGLNSQVIPVHKSEQKTKNPVLAVRQMIGQTLLVRGTGRYPAFLKFRVDWNIACLATTSSLVSLFSKQNNSCDTNLARTSSEREENPMRGVFRLLASVLMLGLLFVTSAYSQAIQTGGITGVVTDQSGDLIKGATVDIISDTTNTSVRTITTGDEATFTATLLPPGTYRVEVTAANFKKAVIAGVQVRTTETTRQDVTLQAGRIEETVNVEATPTLINPENATTGQALDAQTIKVLPLAAPNYLFLLNLSSGVTSEPTDVRSAGRGTADVTVNGQRTSNNSISLEGINVNDFNLAHFDTVPLPNPNTLQEMKVSTSLYDASQGSKGGGALGVVFRTGQKDFHWEGYWQHRNDALNANE